MLVVGWLALAGAAPAGLAKETGRQFIFYPPQPDAPLLQFLASYSDEKDLGRKVNKFAAFVTEEHRPLPQPIVKPGGVFIANQQLWICDTGTRSLVILDLARKTLRQFVPPLSAKLGMPISLALDTDGTRYVTDTDHNLVMIYGADDSLEGAIRENDSMRPAGVALTPDRLYVADLKTCCIRVYDKARRKLLFKIPGNPGADEDVEPGKLFMPVSLAVGADGRVYVSDAAACRIQVYGADGKHLRSIGGRGDLPGQFRRPNGVAVDRENRIHVIDAITQTCQIFDAEGKVLLRFGEPGGSTAPLDHPAAVMVDYDHVRLFQSHAGPGFAVDHLLVIANQLGQKKISVYGWGRKK